MRRKKKDEEEYSGEIIKTYSIRIYNLKQGTSRLDVKIISLAYSIDRVLIG